MEHLCCINLFFIYFCLSAVFSVTLAAATIECGVINTDQLRNKQKYTQIDEFPWMANIAYMHTDSLSIKLRCSAVLIDQQHLVTVGHCLRDTFYSEPIAVLFGDWNSKNNLTEKECDTVSGKCSTPILIDIEEIILYPVADKKKKTNDIALLRLTQKVTYSDFIRPICLPSNDIQTKEFGSEQLTLTGWLQREQGFKQKTPLFVFNQHDCRRKFDNTQGVEYSDSQLCGRPCDDNENYRSGAALMDVEQQKSELPQKVYLVGLISFGSSDNLSAFTRVDRYLNWIKENTY